MSKQTNNGGASPILSDDDEMLIAAAEMVEQKLPYDRPTVDFASYCVQTANTLQVAAKQIASTFSRR